MDNVFKKPYEISLWKDELVFLVSYFNADGSLNTIKEYVGSLANFEAIEGTTTTITQFYKERKLCVIGSNTMETPVRAVNSKLVSNVNGSNTLTFSMYSRYYDEESEEFYSNPFLDLLVNERKVKLRYGALGTEDCKWYDFIIKNIQENSETKVFTYTAKDLFINELSKTGFDLELSTDLENNTGSITKLAQTVLDGSDWQLGSNNSLLQQTKEEPLYRIKIGTSITAKDMNDSNASITIPAGENIYVFYNIINNQESYFQFLYVPDGKYEVDKDHIINNSKNYFLEGVTYKSNGDPVFSAEMQFSSTYRGRKLVRQIQTVYDPVINKYVHVYTGADNKIYYGYTENEYISPVTVENYITSPNSFNSTDGWSVGGVSDDTNIDYPILEVQGFPDMRDIEDLTNQDLYQSFLKYRAALNGQLLFNSGIRDHRSSINNFAEGEKFVFRIKYATATENSAGRPISISYLNTLPKFRIGTYELTDGIYTIKDVLFNGVNIETITDEDNYVYGIVSCNKSMSYSEMIENYRLGIFLNLEKETTFYIEDVQFFRYVTYEIEIMDSDGKGTGEYETKMCVPGGELVALTKTKYIYYLKDSEYTNIDDLVPAWQGYEPNLSYTQEFNDNQYEKIRSITASESNRFNLIQTLCETFECWAKFDIEHNPKTGEILLGKDKTWYDDNGNVTQCPEEELYRQQKWITFREYIGEQNYRGFRYGINLKSIQRTIDSDGTISKIVVKDNANEFAGSGFCSIARSYENPIGENFIYDFSYYIQQGLIGFSEINNDLYMDTNGYLGYYKKLRLLNRNRASWIEDSVNLSNDLMKYTSTYQTYKTSADSANEALAETQQYIQSLTGFAYTELIRIYKKNEAGYALTKEEQKGLEWWETEALNVQINKLSQLLNIISQHTAIYEKAEENLVKTQEQYDALIKKIQDLTEQKRSLGLQFYKKYSRFIQEGSWIDENYIDDNLYYLDAENTLRTSASPKVTYTINVLELSQIEEYENYTFNLGDKTFIEDTEFFGWFWSDKGVKTPYHEEIVVTEIIILLDSPEQNTIKVQNYKTQFEDLFQRITATTQSVEYHTGEYDRVSGVIESDGTIGITTLQNSIANNAIVISNAKDQSVVWDETGITTTSLSNPSQMVRIVSGGVFLSNDGGVTWSTGITGAGINASYLTTGQINTSEINIMNGNFPSFRWDGIGLSAYEFGLDDFGNPFGFNTSKFVRYDQYGIYGIDGYANFDPTKKENELIGEDKIWSNAQFALTWKGFMLKSSGGSGYISITSEQDFQVFDSNNQARIKIGRTDNSDYGIQISDGVGNIVLETESNGELWLKNALKIETYGSGNEVAIGRLDTIDSKDNDHGGRVIDANSNFVVYEDGYMKATGGEFEGIITATGGSIGGLTIDEWSAAGYEIRITSSNGLIFKSDDVTNEETLTILTATLYRAGKEVSGKLTYSWKKNGSETVIGTSKTLEVKGSALGEDDVVSYTCVITIDE